MFVENTKFEANMCILTTLDQTKRVGNTLNFDAN